MSPSSNPVAHPLVDDAWVPAGRPACHDPRVVESKALFGPARELRIVHEGREYRLRVTRLGKLLLTR
jgi:hemin uptake protein HemP